MKSGFTSQSCLRPLLLAGASVLLASFALAQEAEPRMTAVDLGQSGVALYTFTGEVDETGALHLVVPAEHGDDVLASLVVRDRAGKVIGLRTATPSTAPEALRRTPFAAGLPASAAELLQALVGADVRVKTSRSDVTGIMLGIGSSTEIAGDAIVEWPTALLLDAEGRVSEIMLLPGTAVEIAATAAASLAEAARSLIDDITRRNFDLELTASGLRPVELSYVSEAPAWKNSWRLLLDEQRLQGWATFENTSGHDWSGVTVTLSTGNPVAYRRDLLTPRHLDRSEPPELVGTRPEVRVDGGFRAAKGITAAAPAPAPSVGMMEEDTASVPAAGAAQAADVLQGLDVRYRIPQAVDLKSGQTVDLLYLDLPISPEVQALYQPGQSQGVLLAVRLGADQALAPGLVSVRDAYGFVGDAPFTGLTAGQTRLLPYASASGAVVAEDRTSGGYRLELAASTGLLVAKVISQEWTEYRASLPGGVDVFAVEHPRSVARLVSSNGEIEENQNFLRITVPVENGTATVKVVEERTEAQQLTLDRRGAEQLVLFANTGDIEIPASDRAIIEEAATVLQGIHEEEGRLTDAEARHDDLLIEQERLRSNLATVQMDDSRRHYEESLLAAEGEIADLLDTMKRARDAIRQRVRELDRIISKLG